jgi:hypothetical protein
MQAVVKTVASRDLTPKLSRRITRWAPAGRRPVWSVFDLLGGVGDGPAREFRTLKAARAHFDR